MKISLKIFAFYVFSIGFFLLKLNWFEYVFECNCKNDIFPKYYAFPLVYRSNGLGNSMSETFFISGILLNGLVITVLLLIVDFCFHKLLKNRKFLLKIVSFLQILLLLFSLYSYYISYTFLSNDTFEWKSDFKEQVKTYKAECKGYFKGILIN